MIWEMCRLEAVQRRRGRAPNRSREIVEITPDDADTFDAEPHME